MENLEKLGQQLTKIEHSIAAASKKVLTIDDFCLLSGYSKSYTYKLTSLNLIPHSKPLGKSIFFDRSQVEAWLLGKPVKTNAEMSAKAANYVTFNSGKS